MKASTSAQAVISVAAICSTATVALAGAVATSYDLANETIDGQTLIPASVALVAIASTVRLVWAAATERRAFFDRLAHVEESLRELKTSIAGLSCQKEKIECERK